MTNTYFNHTGRISRFTTAFSPQINTKFDAIEAAFDKLPSVTELNQGTRNYSVATNIANAYSVTVPFSVTAYNAGLTLTFLASAANAAPGPATLNVNGIGPITIRRFDGSNLLTSDIRATSLNTVTYDGTGFRLVSMHGGTEALATASATQAAASATQASTSAAEALASRNTAVTSATNAQASAANASSYAASLRSGFRNLLVNPFFWVSQRLGVVLSGSSPSATFIRDRWKTGTGTTAWSIANQGMTITSGSVLQIVDGRNIHFTGTYTISWTGTATCRINGTVVGNGTQVTLPSYTHATVEFSAGSFQYPQLEFGSLKTPPEYRPTDIEVGICSQYYQKSYALHTSPGTQTFLGARESVAVTTVNLSTSNILFIPTMRATPNIGIYNPSQTNVGSSLYVRETGTAISYSISDINDRSFLIFRAPGSDFTVGYRYVYHWVADAEL